MSDLTNKIHNESCLDTMLRMDNNFIDLTVTSPPYDNLRDYNGYVFEFEEIAKELHRVTKKGGVLVWVVGDQVVNGSESCTSFKQALFFRECGFNLHDTMIYRKTNGLPYKQNRYQQSFEYMFVLSKGKPSTFNPIKEKTKYGGLDISNRSKRNKDGTTAWNGGSIVNKERIIDNIWDINVGYMRSSKDKLAFKHPAIFPEQLAHDHITSWSNENDTVFDPFLGSGTTGKIARQLNRNFIGVEKVEKYFDISQERLKTIQKKHTNKTTQI